jgi:ATP-binding cassette subfamily B multidrug efflux pump
MPRMVSGAKSGGATAAQAKAALVTSALLVLGIAVTRRIFTLAHNYLAESSGQSFCFELRLAFFEKP